MPFPKVFCNIVTYHSRTHIVACLRSVLAQQGVQIETQVIDQSLGDSVADLVTQYPSVTFVQNQQNLGFCGAHNQGVASFLESDCGALLILNPDLGLEPQTLSRMMAKLDRATKVGMITPLLLRADAALVALEQKIVDAAGMELTNSLRHLDRGADTLLDGHFNHGEFVFGGTGACLLISRACVEALLVENLSREGDAHAIYPQLAATRSQRRLLFDEAFFAYREDAELAWRASRFGWRCWYEPSAVGYHVRRVTPERRAELPSEINLCSVRNRYLMQINNLSVNDGPLRWLLGACVRNIIVLLGVLLRERSSLLAFKQVCQLLPRALERRRHISERSKRGSA